MSFTAQNTTDFGVGGIGTGRLDMWKCRFDALRSRLSGLLTDALRSRLRGLLTRLVLLLLTVRLSLSLSTSSRPRINSCISLTQHSCIASL